MLPRVSSCGLGTLSGSGRTNGGSSRVGGVGKCTTSCCDDSSKGRLESIVVGEFSSGLVQTCQTLIREL